MLVAIDKIEKLGDGAFADYEKNFGPIQPELKDQVFTFLGIKSLSELEQRMDVLAQDAAKVPGDNAMLKFAKRYEDWKKLLAGLDAMGLTPFIQVDLSVVRGLAYYTGFVFEAFDRKGDLRALAGGGRYNDLIKKLGYPDLPAVGFAIGDVTTGLLLEQRGLMPTFVQAPDVYCVIGGEKERAVAFGDIQAIRAAGYRVDYPLKEIAFGKQFKAAAESGAKIALIYGGDELAKGVVKLRDLTERSERDVPRADLVSTVRDFFSGG